MTEARRPTRAAIAAAKRFNAATKAAGSVGTYVASARDDRVVITVAPAVALLYADLIEAGLAPDNPS